MENLKTLLTEVGRIVQLDAKQREEGEKRGEMFNIFEILKVETDETRAHSAFLAALLNPKGKHGAGDRFLRAFIDTMDCLKDFEFDTQDAKVEIEYPIGNKNEDATEGGRIDILITSNGKAVIIENKIYAGDQEKQLVRYNNYAKKVYRDYRLLYLNLFGSEASEYSVKDESDKKLQAGKDYFPIGYNKEIIDWLDACIAEAARLPLVRESVIQYQNLIKKLTNQNKSLMKEISDKILERPANVKSAIEIANSLADVKVELQKRFWKQLFNKMQPIAEDIKWYHKVDYVKEDEFYEVIEKYVSRKPGFSGLFGLEIVVAKWGDYTVLWTIEVFDNVYYGVKMRNKNWQIVLDGDKEFPEMINKFLHQASDWTTRKKDDDTFLCWDYPSENRINFLTFENSEIYELAKDDVDSDMINNIVTKSGKYIEALKNLCENNK